MTVEMLVVALVAMVSGLPVDQARAHVEAAVAAADAHDLAPELLLGIAYVESRYDPRALSRLECESSDKASCVRKTGVWPRPTRPPNARPSWYCGPMQSGGYVPWRDCQRMRTDLMYGYTTGARELTIWLHDRRCARLDADDQLLCALAGYNGGNAAVVTYKTSRYAHWVLRQRARILKFAERARQRPSANDS